MISFGPFFVKVFKPEIKTEKICIFLFIASTKIQNTFRDDTYLHTLGI